MDLQPVAGDDEHVDFALGHPDYRLRVSALSINGSLDSEIHLGDTVVIVGAGPIGLTHLQLAKHAGARVLVSDLIPERLQKARELGADLALNPAEEDVVARVLELTDGYGCDVYIEASGAGPAVPQGLEMIRKLGTFVEFSVHGVTPPEHYTVTLHCCGIYLDRGEPEKIYKHEIAIDLGLDADTIPLWNGDPIDYGFAVADLLWPVSRDLEKAAS